MKFSESWVREWVSPDVSRDKLVEQITMAGLEVDGVEPVAGAFSGVVVGEVVECGPHPDADKLQVTKVNVGADELLDIVCGAKNCRLGLKVAVATVGAKLPGDFKIKKTKLRGQPSHGMLCSEAELGMADDAPGIMELPADAPVGQDFREYLDLDDATIEVDLTANRSDCLGIIGLAREVGVLNDCDVKPVSFPAVEATIDDQLSIELVDADACPRYLGRVIRNINPTATTPLWMVEKLRRCGIRSIDPVVDITNYVLLELGHPMHAFDLDKLDGGIKVRKAHAGEKMTLLDGNEVELSEQTLLIADQNKPACIAGIFGGEHSGVTTETKHVFLEAAYFDKLAIAGKARSYGLHTDASHRYERGVDPQLQRTAMERATQLLLDIVGGEAGPVVEAVSEADLPKRNQIQLRRERIGKVIGIEIADEQVEAILTRLGMVVTANEQGWLVQAPSYRFDIEIEVDLIEELARVYGYDNIPNIAPEARLIMSQHREAAFSLHSAKLTLVNRGYQEAITYSFVDPKSQAALYPNVETLELPYPISADMSSMRLGLFPGLLQAVKNNQSRQQSRVRLFESGLRFVPQKGELAQQEMLAGVITGSRYPEHWQQGAASVDFYDIKGDVEAILAQVGSLDSFTFKAGEHSALHPGQTAAIYRGERLVGYVGAIHPQAAKKLGVKGKVFLFELELDAIGDVTLPKATNISKFPANRRDLAFVLDKSQPAQPVLELMKKVGGNQLVGINCFDVYQGENVAESQKSLAISLTLQDVERTLEDKEINEIIDNIVNAVNAEFNATLRN